MTEYLSAQADRAAKEICARWKGTMLMEIPDHRLAMSATKDVLVARTFLRALRSQAGNHGLDFVEYRDPSECVLRCTLREART